MLLKKKEQQEHWKLMKTMLEMIQLNYNLGYIGGKIL
jgi:hypothetical protein